MRIPARAAWQVDAAGAAVVALAAAACYGLGVRPVLEAWGRADSDVARAGELRASLERRLADNERLAERARTLTLDVERSRHRLGKVELANERIHAISAMAEELGLRLDQVRPGPAVSTPLFTAVPVTVSGLGTYPACVAFLRGVRERFPDVAVAAMDLRAKPEGERTRAAFLFELTWFAEPAASPSATKPR